VAKAVAPTAAAAAPAQLPTSTSFDLESLIGQSKETRIKHLEDQTMWALEHAVENFENPVFPNAMIIGDCVITHLLHRLGFLETGKVQIMCVDTFYLFDETYEFLEEMEEFYNFNANVFQAEGCANKAEYEDKYGKELWKRDVEQYDKICKVKPFQRGLKTLKTDIMINGRRRDHGNERAFIDMFENAPIGGGLAKVNPLAYWTLEDCFDYAVMHKIPIHPLHAEGYPSIGDYKDTIPVPEDGSVRFVDGKFVGDKRKWLDYACERKGRFVGLQTKDGKQKTECGIHVAGAEKNFDRDLFEASSVKNLSKADVESWKKASEDSLVVVYAPWCKHCQTMEADFEKLAGELSGARVGKFRGDEEFAFVKNVFGVEGTPALFTFGKNGMTKYESQDRSYSALSAWVQGRFSGVVAPAAKPILGARRALKDGELQVVIPPINSESAGLILERSGSHQGVFVGAVSPGSAAFKAGLLAGDRLVALDGEEVKDDVLFTFTQQKLALPGDTVVAVSRDARRKGSISTSASAVDVSRSGWM
jgi:phosphoadenosine phosphosulfate reductase